MPHALCPALTVLPAPRLPARVKVCGAENSGWIPIELTEVAQAIAVTEPLPAP